MFNDKEKQKVCAYVRVSTRSEHQKHSFNEQIEYWTQTLSNNPDYDFVKVYSDYGYSGANIKRPAYSQMIKDAINNKIDLIFTKSLSRFGRNSIAVSSHLLTLKENNVFVIFETENLSTKDDDSNFFISLYSTIHEEELNGISNAIKFGIRNKFESGSMLCKPIFGYDIKRNGNDYDFTIINDEAETVKLIFDLYNDGISFTEIAKTLTENNRANRNGNTIWKAPMILPILSNEKYTGDVLSQKYYNVKHKAVKNNIDSPTAAMYLIENHHEPIISHDTFNAAKQRLDARVKKERKNMTAENDIIQKYLFCGKCGSAYKRIVRKNYIGEDVVTYRCGKNRYNSECCHNSTMYPKIFQYLFIKAYNKFAEIKNFGTTKCNLLNAQIANQQALINDLIAIHNKRTNLHLVILQLNLINEVNYKIELQNKLKELEDYKYALDVEMGHIINNKKIPSKLRDFDETVLINVLEKVCVSDNIISFYFKNGVILEDEFQNPKAGRKKYIPEF